jgi:hypothetical protein
MQTVQKFWLHTQYSPTQGIRLAADEAVLNLEEKK